MPQHMRQWWLQVIVVQMQCKVQIQFTQFIEAHKDEKVITSIGWRDEL